MRRPVTQPVDPVLAPEPGRDVVLTAFSAFFLIGWTALLVPALIVEVQRTFSQSDAGMGFAYLLNAVVYVTGTSALGLLAGRLPRRALLAAGAGLLATGLLVVAASGSWAMFLLGYLAMGLGAGIVDAGVNALLMDLYPGRAAMLNRLHLFFALGALAAPLAVGLVIGAGVPWPAVPVATAVAAALVSASLFTRRLPPSHPHRAAAADPVPPAEARPPIGVPLPLIALGVAIACYVASEIGVSNWLVRYLDEAPIGLATLTLSLYWGALALGRLVSSFIADRMGAVTFATTWAAACGAAVLAAIVVPWLPVTMACFAIAGFAAGPVYPMIMAIGGTLHPGRASTVSSVLSSSAIVGSIVYPPLMGVVSEVAGLWVAMLGAALFAFATAVAIQAGARLARPGVPVGA